MEKLRVQCRVCGKELHGNSGKTYSCGCSNMMTVRGDTVSAVDMSQVIMLNFISKKPKNEGLTQQDIEWQEQRRKRKVRKLDFEIR
jgi:GH24 family phage-related lysozyme (muramidase)